MSSMLKSVNFEHAQATIPCDHCCGIENVKHYCLICEETMCPTCKTIHNKALATRDHQVVLREERLTKDQGSTFCKKHPDQKISLHCDTCKAPVCKKCMTGTHNGHMFSDISKLLENFREIKDSQKKLEIRMTDVNDFILKGEESWKDYENKANSIESSISHDAAVLHSLIDEMAKTRKKRLDSIKQQNRATWELAKRTLDEEKTKISTNLERHEKYRSSTTKTDMSAILEESKVLRSKTLYPVEFVAPSYALSKTSIVGIGEIIKPPGVLNDNLKVGKAVVISSFSSTLKGCQSICYAGNNNILIGTEKSKDIHTVNSKGKIVHKRKNVLRNKCHSLAIIPSGGILVATKNEDSISILDLKNKWRTFFQAASGYKTISVSVTEKQEILVCLVDLVLFTFRYTGRVILCDDKGGNQRQLGSDDLFEYPIQAVQLQDGGFCISDSGKGQRILVLNADGNLKHTIYNAWVKRELRPEEISTVKDCSVRHIIRNPLGRRWYSLSTICTDKAGNILAADGYNDCVYVIGKDMSVRELVGEAEGIDGPGCMCVDDDNNLWIAQHNGKIKVIKYICNQDSA